ncbi:MAG: tetratricopeptide repeat protein [Burkholderiaceae bacterium]|nr:tetratricopeptide repeat protein [Burkholderiaceae bacterium]
MTQETLQLAINEHQAGNYEKAEMHYRSILKIEPNHQHANHNLGLLVRVTDNPEAALPYLEKALQIDIKEEQFWISYIETLLQGRYVDKAIQIVDQAKNLKLNQIFLASLAAKINEFKKKEKEDTSLDEINNLINLYNNKNFNETEKIAISITEKYNDHPIPWKMLGVLQSKKKNWKDAQIFFLKVLEITPNEVETISNLAAVQHELGLMQDAKEACSRALLLDPNFAPAHYNLGRALYELGQLTNAESCYKKAIELDPTYADAYCNLGLTLEGVGRAIEAVEATKMALALNPELHQAQHNLGTWLLGLKRYEEAEIELKKAAPFKKGFEASLLSCYLHQNKQKELYKLLASLLKNEKTCSLQGSVCSRAQVRYEKITPNSYCTEPMNYVVVKEIRKICDFENLFIKPLKEISNNLKEQRLQGLLTNGKQSSGNLFESEKKLTEDIQNFLHLEIKKYRDYFKNSKEGFIRKWPKKYKLWGWLVTMKTGGKLSAHMHETGWISGSIYINVPQKNKENEGNIAFCIEEEQFLPAGQKGSDKIVDVDTGSMCLFPSSLLHYTIPFDSDEERIVLAFDVQPDESI